MSTPVLEISNLNAFYGRAHVLQDVSFTVDDRPVAIGSALLTTPKLLIMDEPSEALAPNIVESVIETIRNLASQGVGLLVVEQNLGVATALADRQLVMVAGRIAAETTAQELIGNIDAQRRFLGVEPLATRRST